MKIGAYNYKFNKQVKLISRYHSVLLVDKIVGTDEYKFTHCNETDVQSTILPTYKTDTLYVSTINLLPKNKQAVITSDTWRHINDIQITNCDVQHLTADTATVKTNTDVDENFITTKYFIDWQKCNAFRQTRKQITNDGLSELGHITSDLTDADYMLGVFNAWLGDNSMSGAYTTTMGGNEYEYIMGVDRNNIVNYTTCGFTVGVKPADNTQENIVRCVGFRKKYIVEITDKQLNI
jgi:hypothetical protein